MKLSIAVLFLLLLLLQYRLWVGDGGLAEVWQLQHSLDAQKAENLRLKERNDALQAEVKDLKHGLEAVEERARNELGMVKNGETFFQIIEEPASGEPEPRDP
jgi:cell division protein FtsB